MSMNQEAGNAAKHLQGKVQEALGNAIGNTEAQEAGKEKQVEAGATTAPHGKVEEVIDDVSKTPSPKPGGRPERIEHKINEALDKMNEENK